MTSKSLKQFIPRAFRYVLKPVDNHFFRFALHDDRENSYSTTFLNISETGLAFIIDKSCVPPIGDIIKVEFPIPGDEHEQVAWFARVIRSEEYYSPHSWYRRLDREESRDVLVAVAFYDLPQGHYTKIRESLNLKFNELLKQRRKENLFRLLNYMVAHFWKILLYLALTLATFSIFYLSLT